MKLRESPATRSGIPRVASGSTAYWEKILLMSITSDPKHVREQYRVLHLGHTYLAICLLHLQR